MSKPAFFAELKRRNVIRAAAFYAASAWLLVQIATQVFPFYEVPNWTVRWVIAALVIGFPFAMLFSWFYEWTPQGLQRESEVAPNESIPPQARQETRSLDHRDRPGWRAAVCGQASSAPAREGGRPCFGR